MSETIYNVYIRILFGDERDNKGMTWIKVNRDPFSSIPEAVAWFNSTVAWFDGTYIGTPQFRIVDGINEMVISRDM